MFYDIFHFFQQDFPISYQPGTFLCMTSSCVSKLLALNNLLIHFYRGVNSLWESNCRMLKFSFLRFFARVPYEHWPISHVFSVIQVAADLKGISIRLSTFKNPNSIFFIHSDASLKRSQFRRIFFREGRAYSQQSVFWPIYLGRLFTDILTYVLVYRV